MLFNSDVFLKFFAAFLLLFWLVRNHLAARNVLVVAASYLFYGWWDWRFLSLLFISSAVDYGVGLALSRTDAPRPRRLWLLLSIALSLSLLGFFKYFDFFAESLAAGLGRLHLPFHPRTLGVILPIGISFYTFQTMSYVIDVYRRQIPATRSFINFLAYVSFFPQLVAGPIERAGHLLPQFEGARSITRPMLEEGLWLILWGMFKKVVLADNFAPLADLVYQGHTFSGPTVALGTLAFGFQIYCDFSGYSDIARGTARVLGFDIMVNFNLPYAATNVRDFWRRWHISLSRWILDYIFIPLQVQWQRWRFLGTAAALVVTFLASGLWHGAAWNFVLWGLWHGLGLTVHRIVCPTPNAERQTSTSVKTLSWAATMAFVFYGWLLFRARSLEQIVAMTRALGDFSRPAWTTSFVINLLAFAAPLVLMEIWQARARNPLAPLSLPPWARATLQGLLLLAIVLFWENDKVPFIYFQF